MNDAKDLEIARLRGQVEALERILAAYRATGTMSVPMPWPTTIPDRMRPSRDRLTVRPICDDATCMETAARNDAHRCGGDMTTRYGCGEWFCGMHLVEAPECPPLCIPCYLDGVAARAHALYAPPDVSHAA